MSIAKKLQYMPKARNRNRTSMDNMQTNRSDEGVIGYTLEEERMLGGGSLQNELSAEAVPGKAAVTTKAQELQKASASMWLQSRIRSGERGGRGMEGLTRPGKGGTGAAGSYAGMQTAAFKSKFVSKHDSRYASNSSLPYKLPPKHGDKEYASEEQAKAEDAVESLSTPGRSSRKDEFNDFIRSTRFANKKNSLVRQCVYCQVLYSTSHVCPQAPAAETRILP